MSFSLHTRGKEKAGHYLTVHSVSMSRLDGKVLSFVNVPPVLRLSGERKNDVIFQPSQGRTRSSVRCKKCDFWFDCFFFSRFHHHFKSEEVRGHLGQLSCIASLNCNYCCCHKAGAPCASCVVVDTCPRIPYSSLARDASHESGETKFHWPCSYPIILWIEHSALTNGPWCAELNPPWIVSSCMCKKQTLLPFSDQALVSALPLSR